MAAGGPTQRDQPAEPLVAHGRVVRVDRRSATAGDIPELATLPEKQRERKMKEIKSGAEILMEQKPLPENRKCRDVAWAIFFVLSCAAVITVGAMGLPTVMEMARKTTIAAPGTHVTKTHHNIYGNVLDLGVNHILVIFGLAGLSSLTCTLLFVVLTQRAPKFVVWSALLFSPFLFATIGIICLCARMILPGLIFALVGALVLCIVLTCYREFIPFTVEVVEVISNVIQDYPSMMAIAVIGSILSVVWTITMVFACLGMSAKMGDTKEVNSVSFFAILMFLWGSMVVGNVCHVTYCGVFGRWYYGVGSFSSSGRRSTIGPSFNAAITTSFGSICFGSFLVAAVRTLEFIARTVGRDAQTERNIACCIVACVIECILACIGDMLEYFNDWAYVQCAIRGASFCEASRMTYSLMTCSNIVYIISDLLTNSVVSFGTLGIAFVTAAITGISAHLLYHAGMFGLIIGFLCGILAGGSALGVINSGVKTILACWADDPYTLAQTHRGVHERFLEKLADKIPVSATENQGTHGTF